MPGIAWKQNGFYRAADPTELVMPQIPEPISEIDTKTSACPGAGPPSASGDRC